MLSAEYQFGPPVAVDVDLDDSLKPVQVDFQRLSENLRRDFPETSQEQWSKSMVLITGEMEEQVGFAQVVGHYKRSKYFEFLKRVSERIPSFRGRFTYEQIKALTVDEDILVAVVAEPQFPSPSTYAEFYSSSPSKVLAHELKHAEIFASGTLTEQDIKVIKKKSQRGFAGLAGLILGGGSIMAGTVELAYKLGSLELRLSSALGGLALVLSSGVLVANQEADSNPMVTTKNNTEELAHAYAIATQYNWRGVITTGLSPESLEPEDWAEQLSPESHPWFNWHS